jgi:hypothetical protein
METGKTLSDIHLRYMPYTFRSFDSLNGYLFWYRNDRTEIWRRASDISGFQIFNPDENQKKCHMRVSMTE